MNSIENLIHLADPSTFGGEFIQRYRDLKEVYDFSRSVDLSQAAAENTDILESRHVLAWHYTRLEKFERHYIKTHGLHLSTKESGEHRLQEMVGRGFINCSDMEKILERLAFHDPTESSSRSGMFWMTANRFPAVDANVERLTGHWGGEVIYHGQEDDRLINILRCIGQPTIIEIGVPCSLLDDYGRRSIVAHMLDILFTGNVPRMHPEFYSVEAIPATFIRRILTPDDDDFVRFGACE